jgi:cytochrome c oxidase subunit 2
MDLAFLPQRASAYAGEVDWLFAGLLAVTGAVLALVFGLMLVFCVRYRSGSRIARPPVGGKSWRWEVTWTTLTFLVFLGLFAWGADLYLREHHPPADAVDIMVVAKQWMWKAEHPGGQREIDQLHVAAGQPVRLVMTSQDVIHSFFVPAFRIKQDVLPGRYETLWFTPTRAGEYRLFCAEYCGTDHAAMGGSIVVMEPAAFAAWLSQAGTDGSLAAQGEALFRRYGCSGCHGGHGTVRAPSLAGLYGSPVPLQSGETVIADDRYLRDSILQPRAQVAAGYAPVMPSFAGEIPEEALMKLIAYIKSLAAPAGNAP